jgi:hypothetical protein
VKADRSRDTFDPKKHYRPVLRQQGRVVLDADDNEQVSIDLATSETTVSDVIGPAGVPETSLSPGYLGGFAIGIGGGPGSPSSSSSSSSDSSSDSGSSSSSGSSATAIMHLTEQDSSIIFYHKEITDVAANRTFPSLLPR